MNTKIHVTSNISVIDNTYIYRRRTNHNNSEVLDVPGPTNDSPWQPGFERPNTIHCVNQGASKESVKEEKAMGESLWRQHYIGAESSDGRALL